MNTSEFRQLGHRVVDMLADYLENIERRPLFPDVDPKKLRALFDEPLPKHGEVILKELETKLFPYCAHVNHPGYYGLMTATPTSVGILGDLIASAINQNVGSYMIGPSATEMERRTVRWLTELVGYGAAGGNLTSGGTLANLIGVKLGRDFVSNAQHKGTPAGLVGYASEERHVSLDKAFDMVGIGRQNFRTLPTDEQFRVRLEALEAAIAEDKKRGLRPAVLIAIAGTTNTGAVDPLPELAAIARREGMWLHIDAAYGSGILLSKKRPGLLQGLELGDSITVDPHKWFYAPVDVGAVLVRDEKFLTASFGMTPPYLTTDPDRYQFYVHGFEQSRRFRSLKVWMSFKRYGTEEIGRWIDRNMEHAERLYSLASADAEFECVNRPLMSAVCLRYRDGDMELHKRVASEIERRGKFWISTTVLKGRPAFRINPINFRTTHAHIDELFRDLKDLCRKMK